MLRLTLKGIAIPVSRDFSMRLTWKSPATDFDKIPGGYGLGLSFPINEHTRALFGNPERYAKYRESNDQKFEGFEVRFKGILLMAGTISINSSRGGKYEGTLSDEVGVLGENERERDILTFPPFTKDIPWVNSPNYDPAAHDYCCFPVVNTKFFKEKGITIEIPEKSIPMVGGDPQVIPAYETEALSYAFLKPPVLANVNALEADRTVKCITTSFVATNYATLPVISVVSPFFFLHKIISEALKAVDFHVDHNALTASAILKRLCIYNNFDLGTTQFDTINLETPILTIANEDGRDVVAYGYEISVFHRSFPPTLKPKDFLPKMKLGTLLLSTQNKLNICFHFLPDNRVNIYSREELIIGQATDLEPYFLGIWDIGEKKDVALNFTKENDNNDLLFAERFHEIEERITDVKEPVADWNALIAVQNPKEGDVRYVNASNNYMEFKMISIEDGEKKVDILGWDEFSIGFQNGWYNRGNRKVEEIKTQWSTCYGNNLYTIVSQMGNMSTWKSKFQAFSPRLLLYNGNNAGGNEGPDFSLDYQRSGKGVIATLWKYWAPFWANRLEVSGRFDLPVNVLRHLIYNICQKYRTREGEFMIEEMSCDIYVDRIGETEIKGFKVE